MTNPLQPYHYIWLKNHPGRTEEWLRDRLADGFHIHHVNGRHDDNTPDNLALIEGMDHLRLHGMNLKEKIKKPKKSALTREERKKIMEETRAKWNDPNRVPKVITEPPHPIPPRPEPRPLKPYKTKSYGKILVVKDGNFYFDK